MPEFSLAAMERILRRAGNERVSKDASLELSAVLESFGKKMGKEAVRKAEQEGVKTVKRRHIKAAAKELEI
ncbi:hypothetical protein AKJ65_04270 [candidate division MSBL1 archaeon SCGC-AAA259E19]|uniref:Transcription factor CBF/NF-Y/archaeal histone domain-containing protein n=3 Tax=candidate division MSBL1 TaxID=215777 RepID=A0A133UWE3_9EURY|nr:hypothetical protein AKJ64_03520 [candidate division MSBL1 archaeon SCGC-AAA259E17]KXA94486.1 hypothetical protein AKJ65_04270 [candidate division MSBL1 archaeon SCGC-AAA259E19]KXA98499.1 hypothetical protein AKJ41_06550 [candidate division MSBL1 archaeon SCGC-AAA259O05]